MFFHFLFSLPRRSHLQAARVRFTKPLAQSANTPTHRVCLNHFHQQNLAQLYQYTQLEVTPNFSTLPSLLYASKFCINLQAKKLLIKWCWNRPLETTPRSDAGPTFALSVKVLFSMWEKKQQFEEQLGALSSDRNIESLICLEKNTIHNNVNISNAA